jgi:hypothetical protein
LTAGLSDEQEQLIEYQTWEFCNVQGVRAHQLWQHEVIKWLHRTQPDQRFIAILTAYMDGKPEGKRAFEQASRLMRLEQHR